MLPQIFANNVMNPLLDPITPPRNWDNPFISSISFKGNFGNKHNNTHDVDMEVVSRNPFGEDVIYVLPQLPSIMHTREINYSVRVSEIFPECSNIYITGIFTNSLKRNLKYFNKWEFLYTPLRFMEHFDHANAGYAHDICMPLRGYIIHQPTRIEPSEIKGTLYLLPQKYPDETQAKKQRHTCYRTCIFK